MGRFADLPMYNTDLTAPIRAFYELNKTQEHGFKQGLIVRSYFNTDIKAGYSHETDPPSYTR